MCNYKLRTANDRRLWYWIKALGKKIDQLGPIGSESFDWLQWEDLIDERVRCETKLSAHKEIVKKVLSRYS